MDGQIEITSCKQILWYLENDPEINGIIEVIDVGLGLKDLGDILMNEGNVAEILQLIDEKKFLYYSEASFCSIPLNNCVESLRLPPYYIVYNLNKLFT